MYIFLKDTHSILRWLVILSGLWALFRVWAGLIKGSVWTKQDRIAGLVFTSTLNVQFLIGLALYGISPITTAAMKAFGAAMKEPGLRFFAVEHPTGMILAVVLAQVGFSISKRAETDRSKFLKATVFYTIAALLIVASIPWPGSEAHGRPLFPQFGQ